MRVELHTRVTVIGAGYFNVRLYIGRDRRYEVIHSLGKLSFYRSTKDRGRSMLNTKRFRLLVKTRGTFHSSAPR